VKSVLKVTFSTIAFPFFQDGKEWGCCFLGAGNIITATAKAVIKQCKASICSHCAILFIKVEEVPSPHFWKVQLGVMIYPSWPL
jgi:hypothetical protein